MARKYNPFMMVEVTMDDDPHTVIKRAFYKTEKAVSNFANRMYNKYGDYMTVTVYDENAKKIMTYHA